VHQVDVEPLETFQESWRPDEPPRLDAVYVERNSLRDALATGDGLSPQNVLGKVELIEPTFQVGALTSPSDCRHLRIHPHKLDHHCLIRPPTWRHACLHGAFALRGGCNEGKGLFVGLRCPGGGNCK